MSLCDINSLQMVKIEKVTKIKEQEMKTITKKSVRGEERFQRMDRRQTLCTH